LTSGFEDGMFGLLLLTTGPALILGFVLVIEGTFGLLIAYPAPWSLDDVPTGFFYSSLVDPLVPALNGAAYCPETTPLAGFDDPVASLVCTGTFDEIPTTGYLFTEGAASGY
jgi:hypothetical protein